MSGRWDGSMRRDGLASPTRGNDFALGNDLFLAAEEMSQAFIAAVTFGRSRHAVL